MTVFILSLTTTVIVACTALTVQFINSPSPEERALYAEVKDGLYDYNMHAC